MAAFLIARLSSHPKSLKAVEFMQKNDFFFRISSSAPFLNQLMSSEAVEERFATALPILEEFKPEEEEKRLIQQFAVTQIKEEADSDAENHVKNNVVAPELPEVKEEAISDVEQDDVRAAEERSSDRRNPRLEMSPVAVQPMESMKNSLATTRNTLPLKDVEQAGDDHLDEDDSMLPLQPLHDGIVEDSTGNSSPIKNSVPIECIVKEEEDISMADQPGDHNPRLKMSSVTAQSVEAKENSLIDVEQAEEEVVADHQEERGEEMNSFLNQVENGDVMNKNVLLADHQEFDESNAEILLDFSMPVAEQGAQAVYLAREREGQNALGEKKGEEDEHQMELGENHEMTMEELLEPLDADDSTEALRPLRNNDVLLDFEDSLKDDLQMEKDTFERNDGEEEKMEEEELIEEQEQEIKKIDEDVEEMEELTDEGIDDEVIEKDEADSDKEEVNDYEEDKSSEKIAQRKKERGPSTGNSTERHLFTCYVKNCPSSFKTMKNLEEHVEIHSGKQEFFCDVCKKEFASKDDAMVHIQERKKKECCGCGKKCSRNCNLIQHYRSHTGEKPFVCKTCRKGFSQIGHLNSHMLTHTGEKPYSCSFCKKGFALKKHVKIHERTHTGEKPYKCSHCDYRCGNSSDLAVHNRRHTGEKPYSCGHCEKRFTQKAHLKTHELTHTKEKAFECKDCGRKFNRMGNFNRHIHMHTGQKSAVT